MSFISRKLRTLFLVVAVLALGIGGCEKSPEDALSDFQATAARMGDDRDSAAIPRLLGNRQFAGADEIMASRTPETQAAYRAYRAAVMRTGRAGTEQANGRDNSGGTFTQLWSFAGAHPILMVIGVIGALTVLGKLAGSDSEPRKCPKCGKKMDIYDKDKTRGLVCYYCDHKEQL